MAQPRRRFTLVDMRVVPAALIVALFSVPYMATQSFLVGYVDARGLDLSVSLFFPVYAVVLLALRFALKRRFDTVRFGPFLLASSVCAVCALVLLAVMRGDGALFAAAACMAGPRAPGARAVPGGAGRPPCAPAVPGGAGRPLCAPAVPGGAGRPRCATVRR